MAQIDFNFIFHSILLWDVQYIIYPKNCLVYSSCEIANCFKINLPNEPLNKVRIIKHTRDHSFQPKCILFSPPNWPTYLLNL